MLVFLFVQLNHFQIGVLMYDCQKFQSLKKDCGKWIGVWDLNAKHRENAMFGRFNTVTEHK